MKKIIRYMQSTALSYSDDKYDSAAYLSPRGKEPQQRRSRTHQHHQHHAEKRSDLPSMHTHSLTRYMSGGGGPYPIPSEVQKFQYGRANIWQSVDVYVPQASPALGAVGNGHGHADGKPTVTTNGNDTGEKKESPAGTGTGTGTPTPKYWVIFLHGGYFRDVKVTSQSFQPALGQLVNPAHEDAHVRGVQAHIAGYASINYRLSPHERYPQDDNVDAYERRDAAWPQQLDDVLDALKYLQHKYAFAERYLLVGHSVGATMALLACLQAEAKSVAPPLAVLGVCGIYDFAALHTAYPEYEHLTRNAGMGGAQVWDEASPARHARSEFESKWSRGRKRWCLFAQSKSDGLVDFAQAERMQRVFDEEGGEVLVDVMEIKGKHNEVWEKGVELAKVVAVGVGEMMGLDQ